MSIEIRALAPLISVFDMPESLAFYRKLGFEVLHHSGQGDNSGWVMIALNGVELMLNTMFDDGERPDARDPDRNAAHNDTIIYFACPDVEGAYAYLREQGIAASQPVIAPYGVKQVYLNDPDGYSLCFQWQAE